MYRHIVPRTLHVHVLFYSHSFPSTSFPRFSPGWGPHRPLLRRWLNKIKAFRNIITQMSYIHYHRKEENARECIFSFFPFTVFSLPTFLKSSSTQRATLKVSAPIIENRVFSEESLVLGNDYSSKYRKVRALKTCFITNLEFSTRMQFDFLSCVGFH